MEEKIVKKILLLGPFPVENKGINGMSIANETLYEGLKNRYEVEKINTSKNFKFLDKKEQGKFKVKKFFDILKELIFEMFHMLFKNYDVIYMTPGQSFWGFMRFSPYMIIAFLKKIPCYIHIHGGFFRRMYDSLSSIKKIVILYFLKRISGVIVLGDSLKPMFEDLVDGDSVFVCKNGVQDYIIASEEEILEKIEKFTKTKRKKILYLSNLMEEKGILDVLKASERFTADEIKISLAGAIEPSIKVTIESYLEKYPQKLTYYGIVNGETKKKLFLENQIFILPTYYTNEGQPISILEAYVNGCCVITTNQGGIRDIFKDKKNGYICEAQNIDSIYSAIKKAINNNFILRNFQIGVQNYSSNRFVSNIENIIIWRKN